MMLSYPIWKVLSHLIVTDSHEFMMISRVRAANFYPPAFFPASSSLPAPILRPSCPFARIFSCGVPSVGRVNPAGNVMVDVTHGHT